MASSKRFIRSFAHLSQEYLSEFFLALEDNTEFLYKTTDFYHKGSEQTINAFDQKIAISWPSDLKYSLIDKDRNAPALDMAMGAME